MTQTLQSGFLQKGKKKNYKARRARLEEHFSKFGNNEIVKKQIKQQLLELNSNTSFSKYKNLKDCDRMQQASLKRQLSGTGTQIKERKRQKYLHEKNKSIILATKWLFLKHLYRKAHILFLWFVIVAFIVNQ